MFFKFLQIAFISSYCLCRAEACTENPSNIFLQATPGSFNHEALELLLKHPINNGNNVHFCGTPLNTFQLACENNSLAFVALKNTIIKGNFVEATMKALQEFQIKRIISIFQMKIEMAVIRHQEALKNNLSLNQIASHPAALQQISKWKNNNPLITTEIPIPEGTGEAARKLSFGDLQVDVAVIGPKNLVLLYPNLVVTEEGIQDRQDNYTTFILVEIIKRPKLVSEERVIEEIQSLLKK